MRRRQFISVLAGAAAWPLAARAQQGRVPGVGFVDSTLPADSLYRVVSLRDGLKEAGFIDGYNVALELRFAGNKLDRLPALAADLVQRHPAVIVCPNATVRAVMATNSCHAQLGTPIVPACKRASSVALRFPDAVASP